MLSKYLPYQGLEFGDTQKLTDIRNMIQLGYQLLDETEWVLDPTEGLIARTISRKEMEQIRIWRNAQTSVLRQNGKISFGEQVDYYNKSIVVDQKSLSPKNILFTLWVRRTLFGYGGLVHIDWNAREAEISFLIRPDWNQREIFSKSFLLFQDFLVKLCIRKLGILSLTAEAFDIDERKSIISLLIQSGFEIRGSREGKYLKNGAPVKSLDFRKRC